MSCHVISTCIPSLWSLESESIPTQVLRTESTPSGLVQRVQPGRSAFQALSSAQEVHAADGCGHHLHHLEIDFCMRKMGQSAVVQLFRAEDICQMEY